MKCPEIAPLVPRFFDGELDGSLMRKIALHVTRCADCERDLRGLEKLQGLVAAHFAAEVESIDVSSIWTTVSAQIEERPRSWRQRLESWWDDLEILSPFTVWPAVAAAAAVFLAINLWTGDPTGSNAGLAGSGDVEIAEQVAKVAQNPLLQHGMEEIDDNSAVFESIVGGVDMLMVEPETQTAVIWIDDTGDFR